MSGLLNARCFFSQAGRQAERGLQKPGPGRLRELHLPARSAAGPGAGVGRPEVKLWEALLQLQQLCTAQSSCAGGELNPPRGADAAAHPTGSPTGCHAWPGAGYEGPQPSALSALRQRSPACPCTFTCSKAHAYSQAHTALSCRGTSKPHNPWSEGLPA